MEPAIFFVWVREILKSIQSGETQGRGRKDSIVGPLSPGHHQCGCNKKGSRLALWAVAGS